MPAGNSHRPVFLQEAVAGLAIQPEGIYVDGTYGRGGHSREIVAQLGPRGRLIAIDRDPEAVAAGKSAWLGDQRVVIYRGAFSMLERIAQQEGVSGRVNGVLLDLGVSSNQLDDPKRGFSFQHDGPLDMRMDPDSGESVAAWLNRATQEEIAEIIRTYGEERYAGRIARAIVGSRGNAPLTGSQQLAQIVSAAVPSRERHKHPATRTFQALRIFINREIDELRAALDQCLRVLAPKARLAVISFHSLEDRLVKRFIRDHSREAPPDKRMPWLQQSAPPLLKPVGKAIRPQDEEIAANVRARSAILRIAERAA
ncbi:MAG: 16S rRNA (cytosine(1402)-N(4))-methyltransferase RsmH [Gammaproteobacteria bacterium]|nr:16S rRNA (cytosine(1402)-N(4))-methyltransferase RsmH [Gammaproteobacteria bacterium]MDE2346382.1 16S rRNA (cytosine(1402)-N(4))-methyltransferase RsmH [Gammaproteobacteria bacterium]